MTLAASVLPLVLAIGWGLVHLLWQAVVVHGSLLLALRLVPVRRSGLRYGLGLVALAALIAMPFVTVKSFLAEPSPVPNVTGLIQVPAPEVEAVALGEDAAPKAGLLVYLTSVFALGWPINVQVLMGMVSRYLPWVVLAWATGVIVSLYNLARGHVETRRLRKEGLRPVPRWLADKVATMAGASVPVLISDLAVVPMVVGVLKPVILVPTSALTGLTVQQLELIIAHELAHVRRFDPIVNQVQCVIEALFFFHPSVRVINRLVRQEREHRTDAEVTAISGANADYAVALGRLAHVAMVGGPHLAATGGALSSRVRRVLGMPERPAAGPVPILALLTVGLLLVVGAALAAPGPGDLAAHIIANPSIAQGLSDEDVEQLLRQTASMDESDEEKLSALLLVLVGRAAEESTLQALYILNADKLSPQRRQVAREALFAAQRKAAAHEDQAESAETYEIPHNDVPNYATQRRGPDLILPAGFDLNRASLAGRDAEALPSGRSLMFVRQHLLPDQGLDRTRLLEDLDLSELKGLPGLEPATFGVLLTKWHSALQGPNRFSNPDFTLAEILDQSDTSAIEGPWSLWVDDGNVVTANTSAQWDLGAGQIAVTPTPRQLLCLEDGVVVGGVYASFAFADHERFERLLTDCLSGAWGSQWNPVPPSTGGPLPAFALTSETGELVSPDDLDGRPLLLAFLAPVEEPPIVMEVGPARTSDAPEPAPRVRVEQLASLIEAAGSDARLVVVAAPYARADVKWSASEVAEALREALDVPVYEDQSGTLMLNLNLYSITAGDVLLLDSQARIIEVFRDLNRLERTAEFIDVTLQDAFARLARQAP